MKTLLDLRNIRRPSFIGPTIVHGVQWNLLISHLQLLPVIVVFHVSRYPLPYDIRSCCRCIIDLQTSSRDGNRGRDGLWSARFEESGPCINQLRFNSNHDLLAVATGKKIYVLLIELENEMVSVTKEANLEGHAEVVKSICWDIRGRYLASVSRDGARVWASTNDVWKSEYELESGGYPFQICTCGLLLVAAKAEPLGCRIQR
ncbi:hypothetical protein E3N88_22015 [Mikania micrantha]|uniref:Uncharacterized protein n=1 Tax=Mikania micrantha TaxID=192012 RepID=A0A5N6N9J9_9ASTR|nr:hypothetical protein E3N88_22015 [Mikania micrantha]